MLRSVLRAGLAAALHTPAARATTRAAHTLPELKYALEKGIAPVISPRALDFHYNKHHQAYVNNLNKLIAGTTYQDMDLISIINKSAKDPVDAAIFNNAAQHFNHSFFWECMTPGGAPVPQTLKEKLVASFDSVEAFKEKFSANALALFGSGWTWLVENPDGKLAIVNTSNAGVPLTKGAKPLLTCDVWEHAYYLDHQNRRVEYVNQWWNVVNWRFVGERLSAPSA